MKTEDEIRLEIENLERDLLILQVKKKNKFISINGKAYLAVDVQKIGGDSFYSGDTRDNRIKKGGAGGATYKLQVPVIIVKEER